MSHELRTPLNSLLILSRCWPRTARATSPTQQVGFAATIHAAGNDLLALINDILDLSKVEAGKMELDLAPLALAALCEDVERAFRPVAQQKGLTLKIDLDPALPGALITDEQRLQQVLRNLLSNAFKFTERGSVTLRIAPGEGGGRVGFSVTDTGVGISDDKLSLIFEAFQQADGTTSRSYGGTGLGLSISREIARLLGGELQRAVAAGRGLDVHAPAPGGRAHRRDGDAHRRSRPRCRPAKCSPRRPRTRVARRCCPSTGPATTARRSSPATASCSSWPTTPSWRGTPATPPTPMRSRRSSAAVRRSGSPSRGSTGPTRC